MFKLKYNHIDKYVLYLSDYGSEGFEQNTDVAF